MTEWKPCIKKPMIVHVREVDGEQEEIRTLENKEGETLIARRDVDYVMKGVNGEEYVIKKAIFHNTYSYVDEADVAVETGVCRNTKRKAVMHVTLSRTFMAASLDLPQKIEDYIYNPQPGQTMLSVIRDISDSGGAWTIMDIKCESCGESMSPQASINHFKGQES